MACRFALFLLFALFAVSGPLLADWVTLHEGEILRGLVLQRQGTVYPFRCEDGRSFLLRVGDVQHIEKSPKGERLDFRGRRLSLQRVIELRAKERASEARKSVQLVEKLTRKEPSDKSRTAWEKLSESQRADSLLAALRSSRRRATREHAANWLGRTPEKSPERRRIAFELCLAAVRDDDSSVRVASVDALEKLKVADTSVYFAAMLRASKAMRRARAADGIALFPDKRATSALVDSLPWAHGFDGPTPDAEGLGPVDDLRAVEHRGSKKSGFSVVQFADPTGRSQKRIGQAKLEDPKKIELAARLRALYKITGEQFGSDVDKWRAWIAEHLSEADQQDPARGAVPPARRPKPSPAPKASSKQIQNP